MSRTYSISIETLAALFCALATPAHSSIFDRDDRQYVSPVRGSAYSPVGRVTRGGPLSPWRSYTTGFLIDDCHVLTSQGVLGYGQAPLGKHVRFDAGIGTPQHESTRGTVVAAGGFRRNRTGEEQYERGGRDWLLLRLDKCVGLTLGHVTLKTGPYSPYEFRSLQSVGYPAHRSKARGLTVDPSCRVVAGRGTVWLNDCATVKGDAGDPIFRIYAAGPKPHMEVYAMQSAGFRGRSPVLLKSGYENQAVPMSLIAPQIERYLSSTLRAVPSRGGIVETKQLDAIPHVGGSPSIVADSRLLDSRLVESDARSNPTSRTE